MTERARMPVLAHEVGGVGSAPSPAAMTRSTPTAFGSGAAIGALGGLIGLGGAEFRLPLLIGAFRFAALQAVILNKAMSLVVVASALPFRAAAVPFAAVAANWPIIVNLLAGSLLGAWFGAGWATRLASQTLYRVIAALLVAIAVVLVLGREASASGAMLTGPAQMVVGVLAGSGIGVVAALLGVAGGELLIPTLVLLFGADIKLAGSLSLAVSLPTMLVGFARYSRDRSFVVLGQNRRFVLVMAAGSISAAASAAGCSGWSQTRSCCLCSRLFWCFRRSRSGGISNRIRGSGQVRWRGLSAPLSCAIQGWRAMRRRGTLCKISGGGTDMADIGVELDCLEGVKVVDFTQFEAGPSCTESLAWLGAEVVKIENPKTGDPGRRLQPGKPDTDPWYFHQFNANKKSLTLDLKSPRGLEIVRALLQKADVTVENMAPGTIERLGLGYDDVKKINPGIIYCQVKGFGTGSPYERNLAFDMIAQAAGGPTSVTGEANQPPVKPGPSFGDTGTGMLMAISILGALYKRSQTGRGRRLQVAMQDAMIHYMRVPFSRTQQSGKAPVRGGSARSQPGGLVPSALYPCKPGGPNDYVYVFCSRANADHWQRLLKVIGRADLSGDERYDTGAARSERAAEVDELIAAWTRQHTKEEAMRLIGAAGVPAGAVFDTVELMNDPSLAERGIMQTIDHPTTGKVKMPAWPVRFDGATAKVRPSPLLGQHNADVLSRWLGMSAAEVDGLKADGIL